VYRRADGRWVAMLDLGWQNGKRRRRAVYGKTRAEVVSKLQRLQEQQRHGIDLAAPTWLLKDWLALWLSDIKQTDGTRPSTWRRYDEVVRTHLSPALGQRRLDRLTASEVQAFLNACQSRLAPATVVKIHAVLRVALSDAERLDLIARNPAKAARPPRNVPAERRSLTPAEARRLLDVARGERLEAAVVVALTTGLRRGELLGLCWEDLDFAAGTLVVRRSLQRVQGHLAFVAPKTQRSARRLPMPSRTRQALEEHRVRQNRERLALGPDWQDLDLVFATGAGTPIEPRNLNHRFELLRERADLPWLRLHDLRHACATFLLAQGVEPRVVMDLLGHSTIRLTMDTYGHALPERRDAAARAMDTALA